ncbi:DNA repair protein RecN [Feifania hominis]|uniref:DNA repair protein RecN n=1 Tax=Feifania hominis TaxID=2763660 RepID=A0A926DAR7_9FIRM|nr:DNA repair protein RecN [Feifania hominis]MBC8535555.1 DNA repair protein RecN [Feifania hominis]
MLTKLYIENIAIIETVTIDFEDGFSVLTGETGAGKSILIDAINMVLGERSSRELIRSGARSALVMAEFEHLPVAALHTLSEAGYAPDEEGKVLLSREMTADGKNTCRIGGRPASVAVLREVGGYLVNIHGQHDNQALLQPEQHIHFLDRYAGNAALLAQYGEAYRRAVSLEREIAKLTMDDQEKNRRIELLRYQLDEIAAADLKPGEEQELAEKQSLLANSQRIMEGAGAAYQLLAGDEETTAQQLLGQASKALASIAGYAPKLSELSERTTELSVLAQDVAGELADFLAGAECDPGELDRIELRLDQIYRLKKKYGDSVEEILQYADTISAELDEITFSEEKLTKLKAQYESARGEMIRLAQELCESRRAAAKGLESAIAQELSYLDMPNVTFVVQQDMRYSGEAIDYAPLGCDKIEFLISSNLGQQARPLAKIASGGELSRTMLALKSILAKGDDTSTLIFDEIDTGVSGRAAEKIGRKLRAIAADKQVICVTHLSQIAALADHQYLIEKTSDQTSTHTDVRHLDRDGRVRELARLISGATITELALRNAQEMLNTIEKSLEE